MRISRLRSFLTTSVMAASLAVPASALQVTVRVVDSGDVSSYTYTIHNDTNRKVVSLRIGMDYLHGVGELQTLPVGWEYDTGLAADSTSSPEGWTATLVTEEESEYFDMQWDSNVDSDFDVKPGATVGGFTVLVPKTATEYHFPQFDIVLDDATHLYGQVQLPGEKHRAVRH